MTTWEEFLMEVGDYAIIASAVVTLIGVIFSLIKNNSLSKEGVDRTAMTEKTLSAEHKEIAAKQTLILERAADSKAAAQRMAETLSGMDRRMLQEEVERSKQFLSLDAQQHQLVKSAADIGKFAEAFLKLTAEKSALELEIARLKKENASLRQENATLRQELDQSQDRDGEELEM